MRATEAFLELGYVFESQARRPGGLPAGGGVRATQPVRPMKAGPRSGLRLSRVNNI